jgi:hypothetical protein
MKFKQSPNQRQRFVISPEIFKSVSPEEVDATWKDMIDLNIDKPPYHHFDLEIDGSNVFASNRTIVPAGTPYHDFEDLIDEAVMKAKIVQEGVFNVIFKINFSENYKEFTIGAYLDNYDGNSYKFEINVEKNLASIRTPKQQIDCRATELEGTACSMLKLLIVLLATKNIEKKIKIDKLAKLGIGKHKHRPYMTTYLHIGKVTESISRSGEPGGATGVHRRPHLRRGHKREQRYGLGLKYTKSIFIQPVFVNADKEWIGDRSEYRVL